VGQYDAINKGFEKSSGEIMAWLNSDDMYVLNSFWVVGGIFSTLRDSVQWITGIPAHWDEEGNICKVFSLQRHERYLVGLGCYEGRGLGWIQQESTFWSRSLWDLAGGFLDVNMRFAADFDLWRRFSNHADLYSVTVLLGGFRRHIQQKTALHLHRYYEEVDRNLSNGGRARWMINRLVRTRLGRRMVSLWMKARRGEKLVSYDTKARRWTVRR
jgi:hypothetical protein